MDDAGTVQRHAGDDAALHQVYDNGVETHFNYVGPHAENHGPFSLIGRYNGGYDAFKLLAGQDVGQSGQKFPVGRPFAPGSGEISSTHHAFPVGQAVGGDAAQVDWFEFVRHNFFRSQ